MTDREAMKMALDAFEDLKKSVTRDGTVSENWDAYYEKEYYALEALRQALAQPEQEPVAYIDHVSGKPKLIDGYVVQTDYDIPLYTKEQA